MRMLHQANDFSRQTRFLAKAIKYLLSLFISCQVETINLYVFYLDFIWQTNRKCYRIFKLKDNYLVFKSYNLKSENSDMHLQQSVEFSLPLKCFQVFLQHEVTSQHKSEALHQSSICKSIYDRMQLVLWDKGEPICQVHTAIFLCWFLSYFSFPTILRNPQLI